MNCANAVTVEAIGFGLVHVEVVLAQMQARLGWSTQHRCIVTGRPRGKSATGGRVACAGRDDIETQQSGRRRHASHSTTQDDHTDWPTHIAPAGIS